MANAASVEELLKAGAHFGHLTRRWNPKMREFIFMQRNGIHIIDLNKTHSLLQESLDELTKVARSGKNVLFVGTKKQAQEIIRTEARRCDMPYVTHRWLGGMLTNFVTIKKSISRMEEINAMKTDGTYDNITKKERLMLDRENQKLEDVMGGIAKMSRLPGALFVVDIVKENIAVNEALKLNIPIFALVDTNCDPDIPDYIIPSNDDAAKAIQLIASNVADAIIEGMAEREAYQEEQLAAETMTKEGGEEESEEMTESEVKTTRRKRTRKKKTAAASPQDQTADKKEKASKSETGGEDKAGQQEESTQDETSAPADESKQSKSAVQQDDAEKNEAEAQSGSSSQGKTKTSKKETSQSKAASGSDSATGKKSKTGDDEQSSESEANRSTQETEVKEDKPESAAKEETGEKK